MTAEVFPLVDCFGAGGGEPYENALRTGGPLLLHDDGPDPGPAPRPLEVDRFLAGADRVERRLLASTTGSVLDVGCGPGRMVAEARRTGRAALGVDVSPESVRLATDRGLPVHCGSVFDDVPGAGTWEVVLLLDGNVGIGGDPTLLLLRSAELASPTACLVVETALERHRDRRFTARVSSPVSGGSGRFPWAEVGAEALVAAAGLSGWTRVREVRRRRRTFVVLTRVTP
ncbi:methyltransferase domain-containing protein [Oryzobacter terrae]|uniref:methyltransferase domain-containing protein n=1 Tax=Oryzobacter terrae TaxID=1620385 RepID=UPI00366F959C